MIGYRWEVETRHAHCGNLAVDLIHLQLQLILSTYIYTIPFLFLKCLDEIVILIFSLSAHSPPQDGHPSSLFGSFSSIKNSHSHSRHDLEASTPGPRLRFRYSGFFGHSCSQRHRLQASSQVDTHYLAGGLGQTLIHRACIQTDGHPYDASQPTTLEDPSCFHGQERQEVFSGPGLDRCFGTQPARTARQRIPHRAIHPAE